MSLSEKIGIVILNYLNYRDTLECLESLSVLKYENKLVVVVENGSPNDSPEKLTRYLSGAKDILLVKNGRNEGFARGNNTGIVRALECGCDHVLVVNNDTVFTDRYMISKLLEAANQTQAAVLGPSIAGRNPKYQNPFQISTSLGNVLVNLRTTILELTRLVYAGSFVKQQLRRLRLIRPARLATSAEEVPKAARCQIIPEGFGLHGSAIFFTKRYFQEFNFGFYQGTFLYYEENILRILLKKKMMQMAYVPETSIYHKENRSSTVSFGNRRSTIARRLLPSILRCLFVILVPVRFLKISRKH